MSDKEDESGYESVPWTDEDRFWFDWLMDSPKLNIALIRDLLTKLITLSAGLAAGSAAFLNDKYVDPQLIGIAIACFFGATILACIGVFPMVESAIPELNAIKDSKVRAFNRMRLWFILSTLAISHGFFAIIIGWFMMHRN